MLSEITATCYDQPTKQPSQLDIQSKILSMPGPVVSYRAFAKNFPRFKKITKEEYNQSTEDLCGSELGRTEEVKVPRATRPTKVYIKAVPNQISYNIMSTLDLPITPALYEDKYKQPSPTAITTQIKAKLVSEKLVPSTTFI